MTRTVVAISRQFGSGGARIGRQVAQRLGWRYADREILDEAARVLGSRTDDLEPLEERAQTFWQRCAASFAAGAVESPYVPPPIASVSETALFAAERRIIEAIASQGQAVIVGRAAAHVLRGHPHVLRVFLHAPMPERVAIALEEYALAGHEAAAAIVRASDAQRARFIQAIAARDWHDATLYDLTLDTHALGLDRAVDLIVGLVRPPS